MAVSSVLEKYVLLAGSVGVVGHLKLGDNVIVTAQSGLPGDVPANTMVLSFPANDNKVWLKCFAVFSRLPEPYKMVRELRASQESQQRKPNQ